METKDYQKLIEELLNKKHTYGKYDVGEEWGDWKEINKQWEKDVHISIEDVLRSFTPEQLIEAIGIEKCETILRAHKLKQLKNKIKK